MNITTNKLLGLFFLLVLFIPFSHALGIDYLCIEGFTCADGDNCNDVDSPCIVNESSTYIVQTQDGFNGNGAHWEEYYTNPVDVILTPLNPISNAEVIFPSVDEDTTVRLIFVRGDPYQPANGYFLIQDIVPDVHECYDINTEDCGTVQPINLMAYNGNDGSDLSSQYFLLVKSLLESDISLSLGDIVNPYVFFNSSIANISPNTIITSSLLTTSGVNIQGSISKNGSGKVGVEGSITIFGSSDQPGDIMSISGTLVFADNVQLYSGLYVNGLANLGTVMELSNVLQDTYRYYFYSINYDNRPDTQCSCDTSPTSANCCSGNNDGCYQGYDAYFDTYNLGETCYDQVSSGPAIYLIFERTNILGDIDVNTDSQETLSSLEDINMDLGSGIVLGNYRRTSWPLHYKIGVDNIMSNPSFEYSNIDISPWTTYNENTDAYLSSLAKYGNNSVLIDITEDNYEGFNGIQLDGHSNMIKVDPNTTYTFSVWVKPNDIVSCLGTTNQDCSKWGDAGICDAHSALEAGGCRWVSGSCSGSKDVECSDLHPNYCDDYSGCSPTENGNNKVSFDVHCFDDNNIGPRFYTIPFFTTTQVKRNSDWTRLFKVIHTNETADHCNALVYLFDEYGSFYVDAFQIEEGSELTKFKPLVLRTNGDVQFKDSDVEEISINQNTIALSAYFGDDDSDEGLISHNNIKADKFKGSANLVRVCDARTNRIAESDGGISFSFGSNDEYCQLDESCISDEDCASPLECNNNICSENCDNGIDDDGDNLVDFCDDECSCPDGTEQFGCSVCSSGCTVSDASISVGDHVHFNVNDVTNPLDNQECTMMIIYNLMDYQSIGPQDCYTNFYNTFQGQMGAGVYNNNYFTTNIPGVGEDKLYCPPVSVGYPPENCGNGIDDDGDNLIDYCDEADCPCPGGSDRFSCLACASCTSNPADPSLIEGDSVTFTLHEEAGTIPEVCTFHSGELNWAPAGPCEDGTTKTRIYNSGLDAPYNPDFYYYNNEDTISCPQVEFECNGPVQNCDIWNQVAECNAHSAEVAGGCSWNGFDSECTNTFNCGQLNEDYCSDYPSCERTNPIECTGTPTRSCNQWNGNTLNCNAHSNEVAGGCVLQGYPCVGNPTCEQLSSTYCEDFDGCNRVGG